MLHALVHPGRSAAQMMGIPDGFGNPETRGHARQTSTEESIPILCPGGNKHRLGMIPCPENVSHPHSINLDGRFITPAGSRRAVGAGKMAFRTSDGGKIKD